MMGVGLGGGSAPGGSQQQNVGESRTAHFNDGADVGAQTRPVSTPPSFGSQNSGQQSAPQQSGGPSF